MCGIAGVYGFEPLEPLELDQLKKATQSLQHRGPDAGATWQDEWVGLGHRRLSILDTGARGNQPMTDVSGYYQIVYNGEVYNYRQIRQELEGKGHHFQTETDTEVVLAAYKAWGTACLDRFNGFFAFAIYDQRERILFIARDRFGIKPLLYAQIGSRLLFASEMRALTQMGAPTKLNAEAVNLYFQLTYIPSPYSIYEDVHKLEPGCCLIVDPKQVVKKRYYELKRGEELTDFHQAKQLLREALERSVSARLVSDVPLGAFLSGGVDSSIISALASRHEAGLRTFSIGFKDQPFFDETQYAIQLSKQYRTEHEVFALSSEDLYRELHGVVDMLDEPFADSSALPVSILSRMTKAHVTVALSGDGADEILGGYNKHMAWMMAQEKGIFNRLVRGIGGIANIFPQSRNSSAANKVRQFLKYRALLRMNNRDRYLYLARFAQPDEVGQLLLPSWGRDMKEFNHRFERQVQELNDFLAEDVHLVLPGDMLRKTDGMSMMHGLEVRVPFLDHELVELAFRIPAKWKIRKQTGKHILREAFRDELPRDVYQRGKHGFDVPLLDWFRGELAEELDQTVFNEELIRSLDLFQWDTVKGIRQRLKSSNPGDAHVPIWAMYVFLKVLRKDS